MIESLQNDKIKYLARLSTDNRFRKKEGVFVVEGRQENARALKFDYEPQEFFICDSIFDGELPHSRINLVSEKVYEKIAYRGRSEGVLGLYTTKTLSLSTYKPKDNATIIVVESVEKPGNLGAILRSCEAFGIDALIVTDAKTDFYNPNVLRSSVGCFFGMNIFQASNEETLQFLTQRNFQILTTFMEGRYEAIYEKKLHQNTALLFGTEHSGLSDFWRGKGENVIIPMAGTIDSINLSNAVAIACYETLRQKKI